MCAQLAQVKLDEAFGKYNKARLSEPPSSAANDSSEVKLTASSILQEERRLYDELKNQVASAPLTKDFTSKVKIDLVKSLAAASKTLSDAAESVKSATTVGGVDNAMLKVNSTVREGFLNNISDDKVYRAARFGNQIGVLAAFYSSAAGIEMLGATQLVERQPPPPPQKEDTGLKGLYATYTANYSKVDGTKLTEAEKNLYVGRVINSEKYSLQQIVAAVEKGDKGTPVEKSIASQFNDLTKGQPQVLGVLKGMVAAYEAIPAGADSAAKLKVSREQRANLLSNDLLASLAESKAATNDVAFVIKNLMDSAAMDVTLAGNREREAKKPKPVTDTVDLTSEKGKRPQKAEEFKRNTPLGQGALIAKDLFLMMGEENVGIFVGFDPKTEKISEVRLDRESLGSDGTFEKSEALQPDLGVEKGTTPESIRTYREKANEYNKRFKKELENVLKPQLDAKLDQALTKAHNASQWLFNPLGKLRINDLKSETKKDIVNVLYGLMVTVPGEPVSPKRVLEVMELWQARQENVFSMFARNLPNPNQAIARPGAGNQSAPPAWINQSFRGYSSPSGFFGLRF